MGRRATVEFETITPERAKQLLLRNEANRNVTRSRVIALAEQMKRGEWKLGWDALACDTTGRFMNGQHRLWAVVESGVTCRFILVEGLPPEAMDIGDTGKARTLADTLHLRGETTTNSLAAIIRLLWEFEQDGVPRTAGTNRPPVSRAQALALLDANPDLRAAATAKRPRVLNNISPALWQFFVFALRRVSHEDADAFLTAVGTGESLAAGDPRLTLRNRLIKTSTTDLLDAKVAAAFVVRCWNAWRRGERMTKVQFKPGGAKPERFPRIDGYPYPDGE